LSFKLCRIGGVIGFDDYSWSENLPGGLDPLRCPKIAVDAFTTIYSRKLQLLSKFPAFQVYLTKTSN